MAGKREFKPDKLGSSWLSKLYLTHSQRLRIVKWTIYTLLLVAVSVIQDVALCRLRIFGATTDMVPLLLMLVCLLEGPQSGGVYALLGALFYQFSGMAPGPYSLVLITALAVLASVIRQAYLQRSFMAALICLLPAIVIYELTVFGFGLFLEMTYNGRFMGFLIRALMTLVGLPVLYPVCVLISRIGGSVWKE